MADVTLTYKGATIGELSETGSKTLKTAGKYCEADILLEYVKSGADYIEEISDPLIIRNGADVGYDNGFSPYLYIVDIRRVETSIKFIQSASSGNIWFCSANNIGTTPAVPYVNGMNTSGFTTSSITSEDEADGFKHITLNMTYTSGGNSRPKIGSWNSSTWSGTNAFKYVKIYDSDGLVGHYVPAKTKENDYVFFDKITGAILRPANIRNTYEVYNGG